jgi:hypothetical protein
MDELTAPEIEFLRVLIMEYRRDVEANNISGYGQSKKDELHDVDELMGKLSRIER